MAPSVPVACPHRWPMSRQDPPSATRSLTVWTESGNTAVSSRRNSLISSTSSSPRIGRGCAMSNHVGRDEAIECFGLTAVPNVEETPDYDLVLLCRCAHGKPPSASVLAGPLQASR